MKEILILPQLGPFPDTVGSQFNGHGDFPSLSEASSRPNALAPNGWNAAAFGPDPEGRGTSTRQRRGLPKTP